MPVKPKLAVFIASLQIPDLLLQHIIVVENVKPFKALRVNGECGSLARQARFRVDVVPSGRD